MIFNGIQLYFEQPKENTGIYYEEGCDNFKFIIHELFLYVIGIFLKHDRFETVNYLIAEPYYVSDNKTIHNPNPTKPFSTFAQYTKFLKDRNSRLKLGKKSLRASILEENSKGPGIEFRYVIQADLVLFLRDNISELHDFWLRWYPYTMHSVMTYNSAPFETFVRCSSSKYFEKAKIILGVKSKAELGRFLEHLEAGSNSSDHPDSVGRSARYFLNFENIATRP